MRLRAITLSLFGALAAVVAAACNNDSTSISHAPTHIIVVAGANQSGNLSAALDSALVVQVLDGANKPVANVPLTWSVVGGGTVSATSTTTDNNGKSTVTWTLAPMAGTQVVTVTSTQIAGATVSFVANNGATITGVVSGATVNPFNATFSRRASRTLSLSSTAQPTRRLSPDRIVVGFKSGAFGLASASSMAYRDISVSRAAASQLKTRVNTLVQAQPVDKVEISPAILASRMRVTDTTKIEAVMAALRADPNVAYVQRDGIISIRDGAPKPMSTNFLPVLAGGGAAQTSGAMSVATKTPNDPAYFEQAWPANMLDLPRAWGITTGSPSVTVAVVDMGVRFDHPNIAGNLTNDGYDFVSQIGYGDTETICATGSTPASTFTTIDGDGDGPDPDPTDPDDLEFDSSNGCWMHNTLGDHGLWTAGIIGAVGNQGIGVAGVNWSVKIRPIRVLGITGDGSDFDIAQGILYAAGLPATGANGAMVQAPRSPIINLSLGGGFDDPTLKSAVAAAVAQGSLLVASAGNDGLDLPAYPAAYDNVLAVSAVGMDGQLATYSNAGRFVSVAAPGGDFRLDDNGGDGVLGPGWNFLAGKKTYLFGYGTSAAAPYVSGVAALLLAQNPTLTATQLSSRITQYATRAAGTSRSDAYGWGIVNAYNALTQQTGPSRATFVRLVDATSGVVIRTTTVGSDGSYAFTKVPTGAYYVQAGDDESGDSTIGLPGRRFATAGGVGKPTIVNVNGNANAVALVLGLPTEVEPNDDVAHANVLTVGSYVIGSITPPDVADVYSVNVPTAGVYTFETSGLVGACGLGIELDTQLSVASAAGQAVGSNDNVSRSGNFCSRVSVTLTPGIYYVTVTGTATNNLSPYGRYRLQVRSGP